MIAFFTMPHVQQRVDVWLHAFQGSNPQGPSYQLVQGLFGFATAGLFGTGWGLGAPHIVPFARTDFMLASLGEEIGLIGVMAILTVYVLIVVRGLRAALGYGTRSANCSRSGSRSPLPAGLRHRRRSHSADPADRPDTALRLVRGKLVDPANAALIGCHPGAVATPAGDRPAPGTPLVDPAPRGS